MKVDVTNHIFPKAYFEKMLEVSPDHADMGKRVRHIRLLIDLDARFRVMDEFGDYCQIISIASPPLESFADTTVTPLLAQIANDGMAELVQGYPDRFPAFIASLPMNNPEAAVRELERAVGELGACGVQIFTNAAGRSLDEPDFAPLFERMAHYDLPILLHPARGANFPDYRTESKSKYEIWWTFGWPYETSVAMSRLVFSGLFERLPRLKIIAHHMGAMIPYFEGRIRHGWAQLGSRSSGEDYTSTMSLLRKPLVDYFHMFYADTALFGCPEALRCGLEFFGINQVLFASDCPFDPEEGLYIRETIKAIDNLNLSARERDQIYRGNAERLFKLPELNR
jgi:predicted TIM-barrel fold metal-dependent hydrolase